MKEYMFICDCGKPRYFVPRDGVVLGKHVKCFRCGKTITVGRINKPKLVRK
jgi:hypothetical protein